MCLPELKCMWNACLWTPAFPQLIIDTLCTQPLTCVTSHRMADMVLWHFNTMKSWLTVAACKSRRDCQINALMKKWKRMRLKTNESKKKDIQNIKWANCWIMCCSKAVLKNPKKKEKKKSKCPQSAAFALGMESQIMDWTFSKAELSLSSLTNSACGIW